MAKGSGNTRKGSPVNPKGLARPIVVYPVARASDIAITKNQLINSAEQKIKGIFADIANGQHPDPTPFEIGTLDTTLINAFTAQSGINVQSDVIYSSAATLTHHKSGTKTTRGKVITETEAESIPRKLSSMDVYEHSGAFVFTDYKIKVVVTPNQRIKINRNKTIVANHTSSSRVIDINEFTNGDYKKIK